MLAFYLIFLKYVKNICDSKENYIKLISFELLKFKPPPSVSRYATDL